VLALPTLLLGCGKKKKPYTAPAVTTYDLSTEPVKFRIISARLLPPDVGCVEMENPHPPGQIWYCRKD
jgi:hypothetical protein